MSDNIELKAEARNRAGKGSARALRREGKIPAVIYGGKEEPISITLPYKETHLRVRTAGFLATIATIDLDGKKIKVLPKDFQADPVKDFTQHVDFLRVTDQTRVTVAIPVHFINEDKAPGLTEPPEEGAAPGILNVVRYEIEVECAANAIPESVEVDLEGLEADGSIHMSDVKLPKGVTPAITDRDFTIATVARPDSMASLDAEAEEAPEETEVIEQNAETVEGEESADEAAPTSETKDSKDGE